jgi:1-aminocyclopropane-1-carboxylate deaminase
LFIKREDLLHPFVSGNKFYKLKYNLQEAKRQNHKTLLTFGGAFSNHIAAVAYAANESNFKSIGIIRGDELSHKAAKNPTLAFAEKQGMRFEFISREAYRNKTNLKFIEDLESKFGNFYLIPEGGTNNLAVLGCEEILTDDDFNFDYICCCVGTGGTISGIINSSQKNQKIIGFPALKGGFLNNEIQKFSMKNNWMLQTDYHFGGYGKVSDNLILFINDFYEAYKIPLDPIYTSKMAFGIIDLISKNYFEPNSKILMIHSGGLQAVSGMNLKLKQKNKTQIFVHE